ncbi:hypothetical protein JCM11251_001682 [Rhodosporidiobolus azoricus]
MEAFSSVDLFSPAQIILGLPALSDMVEKDVRLTLRAVVALSLFTRDETRRSRIWRENPTLTSPPSDVLAACFISRLEDRLVTA